METFGLLYFESDAYPMLKYEAYAMKADMESVYGIREFDFWNDFVEIPFDVMEAIVG